MKDKLRNRILAGDKEAVRLIPKHKKQRPS